MTTDPSEPWVPVTLCGPRHDHPGRLLAVEGSDGSGKSRFISWLTASLGDTIPCTHVLMPGEHLRSYLYWRAWSDKSLGISRSLNDEVGLTLMAIGDRLVRQKAIIEPALRYGHLVICERLALTPLVFKSGTLYSSLLERLYRPDLGILCDAPSDLLLERVAARSDSAVYRGGREDKEREVGHFRLLAESNKYVVIDTSSGREYAELEPYLRSLTGIGGSR